MADSTETTGTTPPTRADRVLTVVSDVQAIMESDSISPETSTAVEKLLDKARQPSPDVELLEVTAKLLKKAQDRKTEAEELAELKFLFDIGD